METDEKREHELSVNSTKNTISYVDNWSPENHKFCLKMQGDKEKIVLLRMLSDDSIHQFQYL